MRRTKADKGFRTDTNLSQDAGWQAEKRIAFAIAGDLEGRHALTELIMEDR
jgi:hypothetical protein